MKMLFAQTLAIAMTLCLSTAFAQSEPHTQMGLPEGATARFGKGYIRGITYSPDGTQMAVSTSIGVWIYDARTGETLNLITGKRTNSVSAAYSPDGKILATGGTDGTVLLWNTRTGKNIKTFTLKEQEYIGYIKYSPDGKTIATKGEESTIELWNARTGKHFKTLAGHEKPDDFYEGHPDVSIASFAYSPDGNTIVSGGGDKTVRLWDAHTGGNIYTLTGHTETVVAVAYSPDGNTIVSASRDKTVRLWDTATGENLKTLSGHKDIIVTVAYSPDGNIIVSGGWDGMLHRWDAHTGAPLKTYEIYTGVLYFARGHAGAITHTAYSPDGKTIATTGTDGAMQWWDAQTGENLKTFIAHSPHSVTYFPDGKVLAILIGNQVQLREAATGKYLNTLKGHRYNIDRIIFSPEGRTFATETVGGPVGIWDANTQENIKMLSGHTDTVYTPVYSPDGKMIATYSKDKTVRLWNVNTGEPLNTLAEHESNLYRPVFSPDSKTIVTRTFVKYSKGGTLRLWNVTTGANILTLEATDMYQRLAYSPDGKVLATNYSDNSVRLWDTTTGENIKTLIGHTDRVYNFMYGLDSKTLATHGRDPSVRLWDTTTGKNIKTLKMPYGSGTDLVRSPDGNIHAITGSGGDKTASFWDVTTGTRLKTFPKHNKGIFESLQEVFSGWFQSKKPRNRSTDHINWKIFSPTRDTFLLVIEYDKIRLWNIHTGKPIGKPIHIKDEHVGRSSRIGTVRYSPNGKMLMTYPSSYKGHVRLWNPSTGKLMKTFPWLTQLYSEGIRFSPDSRKILTEHTNGTVILWDISVK